MRSRAMHSARVRSRTFSKPIAGNAARSRPSRSPCPTGPASAISMSPRIRWSPTMTSLDAIPTTLSDHLSQLGLTQTAADLNDLIARATQKRWTPAVLLETVVRAELDARARQRVERRLKEARIGRFKAMADFEWTWPKQIHRPSVERVLTLDF